MTPTPPKPPHPHSTLPGTAIACALLSSIFSSYGIIFESQAVAYLSVPVVIVLGPLLGGIILMLLMILQGRLVPFSKLRQHWPELVKLILLRTVLGRVFFVYGLSLTPSVKAMFFTKAEPYLIMFFFWLWGIERLDPRHLALLAVHIAGAVLLSTGGEFSFDRSMTGDLLIFAALVVSAMSYRYAQTLSHDLGVLGSTGWSQLIGGLLGVPWLLWLQPEAFLEFQNPGWLHLVAFVLLFNVFALTLWYAALKSVAAWMVSALRAVGPLAAAPFAWYMFGQTLSLIQVLGGALVLLTSALIAVQHWRVQTQKTVPEAT